MCTYYTYSYSHVCSQNNWQEKRKQVEIQFEISSSCATIFMKCPQWENVGNIAAQLTTEIGQDLGTQQYRQTGLMSLTICYNALQ